MVVLYGTAAAHDIPLSGLLGFTNSAGFTTKVNVQSNGQFRARLPVGSYRLDVLAPGSEGGAFICPSSPIPVVVKQDSTVTDDVVCQPGGGPPHAKATS
jgi:hypothetical protein